MLEFLINLDSYILLWIQDTIRMLWLNPIMIAITTLGNVGAIWIVGIIFCMIYKKTRWTGITALTAMAINLIFVNGLIKNIVARTRPYEVIEGLQKLIKAPSDYSFPSGHTTHAIATGLVFLILLPKKYGIPAFVLAVMISLSRLYIGVHYPSDVLGGAFFGACSAIFSVFLIKKIKEVIERKKSSNIQENNDK